MMKSCSVIDAPSDLGLRRTGVDGLPDALREAGLLEGLHNPRAAGRVPVPEFDSRRDASTGILNLQGIITFARRLAERVAFTLELGHFPLVLGGDCSILLGPALATRRRGRFGLFFIDGHADFYSPDVEPNGEAASMELAFVTGHGPCAITNIDGLSPLVREEDVVVFGFRDAESASDYDSPDVRKTQMHAYDLPEVRRLGSRTAALQGLDALEKVGVDGFWIHLDADVLHDDVMPAVDYRMPGGLWPTELRQALSVLLASPLVVGMDVTIYNPSFDDQQRSAARALAEVITRAFASVH